MTLSMCGLAADPDRTDGGILGATAAGSPALAGSEAAAAVAAEGARPATAGADGAAVA